MKRIYLSPPHLDGRERELLLQAHESNWIAALGPHVNSGAPFCLQIVQQPQGQLSLYPCAGPQKINAEMVNGTMVFHCFEPIRTH
jgi:hypothetical protein